MPRAFELFAGQRSQDLTRLFLKTAHQHVQKRDVVCHKDQCPSGLLSLFLLLVRERQGSETFCSQGAMLRAGPHLGKTGQNRQVRFTLGQNLIHVSFRSSSHPFWLMQYIYSLLRTCGLAVNILACLVSCFDSISILASSIVIDAIYSCFAAHLWGGCEHPGLLGFNF